jgi:twinkle protein
VLTQVFSHLLQIIAAMDHAVYRDDIQHIIIDNLQFMTSNLARGSSGGSGSKKSNANPFYEAMAIQDMVVDKLRAFATEKDVSAELFRKIFRSVFPII